MSSAVILLLALSFSPLIHVRISAPFWIGFGLFLGSASHLFLDGFNDERQWWGWPFTKHGFRWPLHMGVRYSDSAATLVLAALLAMILWHLGPLIEQNVRAIPFRA
jgi:membrane-bound metal-dependent hydrolase YbcI (DUF457 family)